MSYLKNEFKFDNRKFNSDQFAGLLEEYSPKVIALLNKITELDTQDYQKHKKKFKHFIFSDLDKGYGAKLVASAFLSKGFKLVFTKTSKSGLGFDDSALNSSSDKKFALLSSTPLYSIKMGPQAKKAVLSLYNSRPDNVYGQKCRFIILDAGFKEGIDLFDVKYVHILEPQTSTANTKQAIGRATRTCGQKGLDFIPNRGWPLEIFIYDTEMTANAKKVYGVNTMHELFLTGLDLRKMQLADELERYSIVSAVDYKLNKTIHNFKIEDDYELPELFGGAGAGAVNCKGTCGMKPTPSIPATVAQMLVAYLSIGRIVSKSKKERVRQHLCNQMKNDAIFCDRVNEAYTDIKKFVQKYNAIITHTYEKLQDEYRPQVSKLISPYLKSKRMAPFAVKQELINTKYSQFAWPKVKLENDCVPKGESGSSTFKFTPTQDFVRHYFTPDSPEKGMLFFHTVGTGKCHAKDTPILMYDGTIKMVQDIMVGDILMGDDSTPRKVLSLAQGTDDMYDIIPTKGDKYTVNSEHILVLKYNSFCVSYNKNQPNKPYVAEFLNKEKLTTSGKSFKTREEAEAFLKQYQNEDKRVVEIEVKDFLKLSPSMQKELKGIRKGVEFANNNELPLDPYFIGVWLGDGSSRDPKFTTADKEILDYMTKEVGKYGLSVVHEKRYDYRITGNGKVGNNYITNTLRKLKLINNKHIPQEYLTSSRKNRLRLLAGLIDTDGSYSKGNGYDIIQKSSPIATGILFLARSLGFAAYSKQCQKSCVYKGEKKTGTYHRIQISGNIDQIPVLLERKKANPRQQKKDVLVTGIKVNHVGKGNYYGFTLDGNNRYLLGDFTVTHNTCSAIATASTSFETDGYTILWVTRTTLKSDIWKNQFDQICNMVLQEKLDKGAKLPSSLTDRKKLLSKAWKIPPLSYKQFTNLITQKNRKLYNELTQINGKSDPLRKTLLIIDEAHKLYGGDDLSAQERPNMPKLYEMIQNSYKKSGDDSVKVLLMTATPYTNDPMEMVKLLNLIREDPLPDTFESFAEKYLDDTGHFTKKGKLDYMNDVAGYISYLNRGLDARQFAQPNIHKVLIPMTERKLDVSSKKELNKKYSTLSKERDETIEYLKETKRGLTDKISDITKDLKTKNYASCKELKGELKERCKDRVDEEKGHLTDRKMSISNQKKTLDGEIKNVELDKKGISAQKRKDIKIFNDDFSQEKMLLERCKV
jgi:hypothetical protein